MIKILLLFNNLQHNPGVKFISFIINYLNNPLCVKPIVKHYKRYCLTLFIATGADAPISSRFVFFLFEFAVPSFLTHYPDFKRKGIKFNGLKTNFGSLFLGSQFALERIRVTMLMSKS